MPLFPKKGRLANKDDSQLLAMYVQSRDMQVLGELYGRYMHLVYGVCLKYLKNSEDSKDAVIQVFEKISIEITKHEIGNFKSWLHVVTKNFCLMELRKKTQKTTIQAEEISNIFMENKAEIHPIDREDKKLEEALSTCIKKLKDEQKQCILQFYYENKSYREISILLKLDEKKVKSHIQNGKRNLKICLEKQK